MGNNRTPEIRFSGYSGDWEEHKIGEFLKESRIAGTNGVEAKKLTVKLWGKGVIPKDEVYQGSKATKYYIRKAGQFIYGKLDFLHQAFGIIPDELDGYESTLDSPAFNVQGNLNSYFFLEYVSRKQFYLYQGMIANGSRKAKRIHSETFLEMPLIAPVLEEQNQIGNFFKQLDNTIALHQQELTNLKQSKQGFLQKMFPKEGESVPEIRFPGFTGEWKERKLSDITKKITKGTTPKDSSKGNINFIKVENINPSSGSISVTSKISKEEHEGYLKRSQLELGDILFSIAGTLGRVTIVNDDVLPANTNQALAIIRLSEGDINFVATYLKGRVVEEYIRKNPTVGAQPNLSLQQVGDLIINYPNIREQEKVGAFFKHLDDTIALHQRELELLKETKKAFLQKMFV